MLIMSNIGGPGSIPFLREFLSGSYYIVSMVIVLLGLVSFLLSLKWRDDELERREQEHPTKTELATVVIRAEDRMNNLEKFVLDSNRRIIDLQEAVNKLNNEIPVLSDRQNNNSGAIRELQQRIYQYPNSDKGPTAPILLPPRPGK